MCAKKAKTTKKKIVSAAWKLFYEQGYDNTTVDDIVEESGTSKGSFYHYFEGKDAVNILESAEELHAKKITLPPDAQQELSTMEHAVQEIIQLSLTAFQTGDLTTASRVEPLEQVIDTLKGQLRTRQIARLQKGACSLETGFIWTDLLTNFERVADHCSNIAGCVLETQHRSLDLHEYLDGIKQSAPEFRRDYEIYSRKYALISA